MVEYSLHGAQGPALPAWSPISAMHKARMSLKIDLLNPKIVTIFAIQAFNQRASYAIKNKTIGVSRQLIFVTIWKL